MDILLTKHQNGLIEIEPIKYATFNQRPNWFGEEKMTFIDSVKHIIEEKTNLKVYKIGWQKEWREPDGHGGGEYWGKLDDSYVNQIDMMISEHPFNTEALEKIKNILSVGYNEMQYSYIIPYLDQKSQKWEFLINEDACYENNCRIDNVKYSINYKKLFTQALEHANEKIEIHYDIENYNLKEIESTPLLSKINPVELIKLISPPAAEVNKLSLAQLASANNISNLFEQYKHNHSVNYNFDNEAITAFTLVERYNELRSQVAADVLLVQCGKFYNALGEDAKIISEVANVKIISKKPENIPMIGIPVESFESKYNQILTESGLTVNVFDNKKQLMEFKPETKDEKTIVNNEHLQRFSRTDIENAPVSFPDNAGINKMLNNTDEVLTFFEKISPEVVKQLKTDGYLSVPGVNGGTTYLSDNNPEYLAKILNQATGNLIDLPKKPDELVQESTHELKR